MKQKLTQLRKLWWKQCISILLAVTLIVTSLYLPADAAAVEELPEGSAVTEDVTDETILDGEENTSDEMQDTSGTEDLDVSEDAPSIGESEAEALETAETAREELSGLEADGMPVERLASDEVLEQDAAPEALILSEVEEQGPTIRENWNFL